MDYKLALRLGLRLKGDLSSHRRFVTAGRAKLTSLGKVELTGQFMDKEATVFCCTVYVVKHLAVPLIFGESFLEQHEIHTKKSHLLRFQESAHLPTPTCMLLSTPRQFLTCMIQSEPVLATADTGSNVDLMSLRYAQRRGFKIARFRSHADRVMMADGSLVKIYGTVTVTFTVGCGNLMNRCLGWKRKRIFYLLKHLSSDVLLGDATLHQMKVFRQHRQSFVTKDSFRTCKDLQLITLLGRLEQRIMERRRKRASNSGRCTAGTIPCPNSSSTSSQTSSTSPPRPGFPAGIDFHKWLDANDQRELHRRQEQQRLAQFLSGDERTKEDESENGKKLAYEAWRAGVIAEHDRRNVHVQETVFPPS